ncbi:hypothetical protein A7A08_02274 [Methyloligella halotolerans]|uniref:Glyoxalase-related protein domain-containing protein n=1 Tax=Methyloligella halotolerans TaxID=1177755 RepID=A0A1E2RXL1_9HYPH|nr:hypothetical protein A7A08_02274 [Methyloligella halotolerans]
MTTPITLPSLFDLKTEARQLRQDLAAFGTAISHGQSLERIANRHAIGTGIPFTPQSATGLHAGP